MTIEYSRLNHVTISVPAGPAENRHVALEVKELKTVRAYLESKNAKIREAVVIPDRERFHVLDPFGNYFELIEMKTL